MFLHHHVGGIALPTLCKTPVNFCQSTSGQNSKNPAIGSKCGRNFLIRPYSEQSCGTSLALFLLLPVTCSFYYYQDSRNWSGCVSNCFIFQITDRVWRGAVSLPAHGRRNGCVIILSGFPLSKKNVVHQSREKLCFLTRVPKHSFFESRAWWKVNNRSVIGYF